MEKRKINIPWLFKMAWRDSRQQRSRLFLFISAILFGIAALVAIYSFRYNIENDINNQAATLVGADLVISSNQPVEPSMQPLLDSVGQTRSEERSFASMVYFPKSQGTRLVQVRALHGGFPYYGQIETMPAAAAGQFRDGQKALVDRMLILQFNVHTGDSIKVGNLSFLIAGILNKAPGQTGISTSVAPIVYIPLQYLQQTGLTKKGSRINYSFYYKLPQRTNADQLVKKIDSRLDKAEMNYETVETRKENTGRSFEDLTRFLSLVGFIALLLGCVGVASAIHIYIREKIATIAIMRCLGVRASEAFLIFLIQIVAIGFVGSVIGAVLGTSIQHLLPFLLKDFLPFTISVNISWLAILQGILLGVTISILFALLPLISIRNISPLNTLRMSYEELNLAKDPLRWLVYGLILSFIILFTFFQLNNWPETLFFTLGLIIAFLILALVAWALMHFMKLLLKASWSYLPRQGFANLYRPNNQTITLIVSIGLSTAFICTLFFIQQIVINQVTLSTGANQPNMLLFDIQSSQEKAVAELTKKQGLPVIQQVPIVTLRLEKVNGKTAADIKKDSLSKVSSKAFANEYRVTYRDSLTQSEKVIDGVWSGKVTPGWDIPVSIEESFSKRTHIVLGDHLIFNVQGVMMPTVVGSIRKVNWNKIQTNFQVVFPAGVLEDAPQFHVLLTHVPSAGASARFQQTIVRQFPNVVAIDLGQVITVVDELLTKIGYVIQFMSAFSIITGLIVLIASVRISKYQRIKESVLLRSLGASGKQIFAITAYEYLFLGILSALTGILIAMAATWLLAKYSFEVSYGINYLLAIAIFLGISLLTVLIGLLNSRSALNNSPLEILRSNA
jgi:putative ABC transport system permease protein